VTIVSRDAEGVWTAEGGTVDPVAGAVTTIVGHFSAKGALKRLNDITEVPRKVGSTLVSAFKDAAYDAPAPKCDPGSRLWTSRTNGNNVKVCVKGGTDDQPSSRLRVVNNRLYGQFLQLQAYPKLIVDQQAKADPVTNIWRALAEVNPDYTYLAGKETLDINLAGGYRSVDFVARPGLEAVIMKIIVDTAGVAMAEAKVVVGAIRCVLAKPVFNEVVRERAYRRIPELGAEVVNCVTTATGGWKVLKGDASADEEAQAKKDRSAALDAWSTAMKDLPTVLETIVQGGFIQRWDTQHVIVDRSPITPDSALNESGAALPTAVAATQKKLYTAAARYRQDRYALSDLQSPAGLVFGNAADQDQKPSLTPGLEPDPIAGPKAATAIMQLTGTPPLRWKCPETGRDSYVYGSSDPELDTYPGRVKALGFSAEETTTIRETARAARPYRLCIDVDGTWSAFSRKMPQQWPTVDALRIEERATSYTQCAKPLISAFVPPDAYCPTSIRTDIDGDGKKDALVVYRRGGKGWTARAVLTGGPAADLALPVEDEAYPDVNVVVLDHADMDGAPGEETAISVGVGAHSEQLVLLTYTGKGLAFVRHEGGGEDADRFSIDSSVSYSVGIGCTDADHDGRPELVEGSVVPEYDQVTGDLLKAEGFTTSWEWRGKTLVRQSSAKRTFAPSDEEVFTQPPYQGLACSWR
jgi:hypothetical protein